ncbi:MAG TPA: ATP-dependent RNA helicase HrpA [Verrucomicrobiales bacterium]|nr:ATP-dependent RNA helicase HrpA [Verrucomicrobiales bacterium]
MANRPAISCPAELPLSPRKDEIVEAIRRNQVVVIAGETGSGKTTQIPKLCLEAGLGIEAMIGCTQPRRVAALSISRRIAEELGVTWGREVGCKIRFDDRSSPHTYIKLMTDGILLAETQGDPDLSGYNAIILDEAHERSLNIDFLLGYLKTLLARRRDLKLIVTSATIDTEAFSRHFDNAPVIEVSGRVYPVDVVYAPTGEWSLPDIRSSRREEAQTEWGLQSAEFGVEERSLLTSATTSIEDADVDYVEAAVRATERVVYGTHGGDVLIFLPGERDIREVRDLVDGRFAGEVEVIPLFGRLSAGEQQRVFAPASRRKVVIATNIAETSLTIPGIRFVIDAGLARMSRYNPRTRTKRLPIEPVSQSSANQRKGRAGRVEAGLCIRLYSEDDFNGRPPFTQPEIQRANLAEVILRMKAFRLGEIETFPFVQPPTPKAVATGYTLLQELGALDGDRGLTQLGRDLARLPIDPTLGRMLLQSQQEHASRELLIIAAGLSIQDPRERPLDQKDAAGAAHRQFTDPGSDFLTLLNIWNAVHDEWESIRSQNQRRRFCRKHFLSYLRMREWQDLHRQLHDALEDRGTLRINESNAHYDAIHRSILAGLIGHVAAREERNAYKGFGNRPLTVFPGSALFERSEPQRKPQKGGKPLPKPKSNQPRWIVAGEIVETSQLFARTVAGIDPQWVYQLAPHCCQITHVNPHWSARAERVLAEEIVTLHGLEVQRRKVDYGNVNPREATAIFIRAALVEDELAPGRSAEDDANDRDDTRVLQSLPSEGPPRAAKFAFLEHNRAVRQKIENWQTRVRHYGLADLDQRLFDFYAQRIENISSVHDLNRWLREHPDPQSLCITEEELVGGQDLAYDADAFPDAVPVGGQPVALSYAYAPGEEHDGVTIRLPFTLAQSASAAMIEWAVPGMRAEKIAELIRSLPRGLRRELQPYPPKIEEIVRDFRPEGRSFVEELGRFIHRRYGVEVPPAAWPPDAIRPHLRPRVEIVGPDQQALGAGRDLEQLRRQLAQTPVKVDASAAPRAWQLAAQQWERFGLDGWSFGDLPDRITVSEGPGLPLYAWPGLEVDEGLVNLKLFHSGADRASSSLAGFRRLVELAIQKDLGWLEKDLRGLSKLQVLHAPLGSVDELRDAALANLKDHLLPAELSAGLTEAQFQAAVTSARERLPGLAQRLIDQLGSILELRRQVEQRLGSGNAVAARKPARTLADLSQLDRLVAPTKPASRNPLAAELDGLLPANFLATTSFDRLQHLPRYLKALLLRVERAAQNPPKDREKAATVEPYVSVVKQLAGRTVPNAEAARALTEFRWLVEEFKVSVFAQELGTAVRVSPKRLEEELARVRGML